MERDPSYAELGLVIPKDRVEYLTKSHPQVVRQDTDDGQVWKKLPDGTDLSRGRGYNAFWVAPGSRFALINGEYRTSMVTHPTNGLFHIQTKEGNYDALIEPSIQGFCLTKSQWVLKGQKAEHWVKDA